MRLPPTKVLLGVTGIALLASVLWSDIHKHNAKDCNKELDDYKSVLDAAVEGVQPQPATKDRAQEAMEATVGRSGGGQVVAKKATSCGAHLKSSRFFGSPIKVDRTTLPDVASLTPAASSAAGVLRCESACHDEPNCLGWSFRPISDTDGECAFYDNTDQTTLNTKFTSGICREPQNDDKTFENEEYRGENTQNSGVYHIAMIFDNVKISYAMVFLRSMQYFSTEDFHMHLVVPPMLVARLKEHCSQYSLSCSFYDFNRCEQLIAPIRPYGDPNLHNAAICKLYLADLLPATVDAVQFVDNDVVVVQDPSPCFNPFVSWDAGDNSGQHIGMGFDMGETCQADPNLCWPIGQSWIVQEGLVCGTTPARAARLKESGRLKKCAMPGQPEPIQFNAGVIFFNLTVMREINFNGRLLNITAQTARMAGPNRIASWGDQEYMANYVRFYPESLRVQPCGCNYQWTAARRTIKCPDAPVYMGHGWHAGTTQVTRDPYNKLYHYFKDCEIKHCSAPPFANKTQHSHKDKTSPKQPIDLIHNFDCPQQNMACDEDLKDPLFIYDVVYVLTRTSNRPNFFAETRWSVSQQSHRSIKHVIVTDDPNSLGYISGDIIVEIPSRYNEFDAMEPCDKCGASASRGCGNAPYTPKERDAFLDCYCKTGYPMNTYMEHLHKEVAEGWIIYLDDDNLLYDKYGIGTALTHARSPSDLLLWRAKLGRLVPLDKNFGATGVVRGDCDSANFMFNSKFISSTKWGNTRCGDYRTLASLADILHLRWINRTVIAANPMRQSLGGLGLRGDGNVRVTVVITSCTTEGFRPFWLQNTVSQYLSPEYRSVVDRVIVVWNSNTIEPPPLPPQTYILRQKTNSLNNRWTKISESVRTEAILNLDDDVFINKAGIVCLLNWWSQKQDQLVGPFVRKNDGNKYVIDELYGHKYYSMMLPRVMMLGKAHLKVYRTIKQEIRDYVDSQVAHCDDITMNVAVAERMKTPPFRVMLPAGTVTDYYEVCWKNYKNDTAGLGLQEHRATLRSECMEWILNHYHDDTLLASSDVGACDKSGTRLHPQKAKTDDPEAWKLMFNKAPEGALCVKG